MPQIKTGLAAALAIRVREYVANTKRELLEELERRIAAIPHGPKGDKGESIKGDPGKDADPELVRALVVSDLELKLPKPLTELEIRERILPIVLAGLEASITSNVFRGIEHLRGAPGKDANQEAIIDEVLKRIPVPINGKDGKDGKDGENGREGQPGMLGPQGVAGKDGRDGIDGKDGQPGVDGKSITGERGIDGTNGKDGRDGRDGKDGKDGRDGERGLDALQLDILPAIDPAKSYLRGTYARHNGGLVRYKEDTWEVITNGIASIGEEKTEDPRQIRIVITLTNGEQCVIERHIPFPLYKGVYGDELNADRTWMRGDTASHGGSVWHCNINGATSRPGTPGSREWTLMVKEGRRGKDAELPKPSGNGSPVHLK